jgi:hypothetical protein
MRSTDAFGFPNDRLTRFVIDVRNTSPFFAGDLPESPLGALAAVGLEPTTDGQALIAPMAQGAATKYLACTGGGEIVFSDVNTEDDGSRNVHWLNIRNFDHEVEIPLTVTTNQFSFFMNAQRQDPALMLAWNDLYRDAAV